MSPARGWAPGISSGILRGRAFALRELQFHREDRPHTHRVKLITAHHTRDSAAAEVGRVLPRECGGLGRGGEYAALKARHLTSLPDPPAFSSPVPGPEVRLGRRHAGRGGAAAAVQAADRPGQPARPAGKSAPCVPQLLLGPKSRLSFITSPVSVTPSQTRARRNFRRVFGLALLIPLCFKTRWLGYLSEAESQILPNEYEVKKKYSRNEFQEGKIHYGDQFSF